MTLDGAQQPEGWIEKARAIRELGAVGAMIVLVLAGAWATYNEVLPLLRALPALADSLKEHRQYEAASYKVLVLMCKDYRGTIKANPDKCDEASPIAR